MGGSSASSRPASTSAASWRPSSSVSSWTTAVRARYSSAWPPAPWSRSPPSRSTPRARRQPTRLEEMAMRLRDRNWRWLACLALAASPAAAADFYAGKTIDFEVGADVGGGYDIYARTLARNMARHIPGNPTIVVKNMPGAGSGRTALFISNVAPKDGATLGALMPGAIIGPLLDDKVETQFDPTKVIYIGSADAGTRVCATYQSSKIKTFEDARSQKTILGGTAAGGATRDYGYLHNHTAGTKFEVVAGYKGTADIGLAMERGEVDGSCGWDWSSIKSQKADWVRDHKANILVQVGLDPNPELTQMGVPEMWKFIANEDDRRVAELVVSQQIFQRSYI